MGAIKDLADYHQQISKFFKQPQSPEEWEQYKLTQEQIEFYHEYGHLSGIKLLEDWQVEELNKELAEIVDPTHPAHHLFYEFHSNESIDPNTTLFHSLGHWRITNGFHDVLSILHLLWLPVNC